MEDFKVSATINNPTPQQVFDLMVNHGLKVRFDGTDALGYKFIAQADMWLIRFAWGHGLNLEALADGFGRGIGTMGDWSAVRDSSSGAVREMTAAALAWLRANGHIAMGVKTVGGR
jgi:hypothetical protein